MSFESFLVLVVVGGFAILFIIKVREQMIKDNEEAAEEDLIAKERNQLMNRLRTEQEKHQNLIEKYYSSPLTSEIISILWAGQSDSSLPEGIEIHNDYISAQFRGNRNVFTFQHHHVQPLASVTNISGCTFIHSSNYICNHLQEGQSPVFDLIPSAEYAGYLMRPQMALAEALGRMLFAKYNIKYVITDHPQKNKNHVYEAGHVTMRLVPTRQF